jgi:hypothetical protein
MCAVDSSTRECLGLEVDSSSPSRRVTRFIRENYSAAWSAGDNSL